MRVTVVVAEAPMIIGQMPNSPRRRLSLAFLTNTLAGGGAEKQLLLTAAGLAERGHACKIYCLSPAAPHARYGPIIDRCRHAGVTFFTPRMRSGGVGIVCRLAADILFGRVRILWTWGFRAELIRTSCPLLWPASGVVALRSASRREAEARRWILRLSQLLTFRYIANSANAIETFASVTRAVRMRGRVVYNALEADFLQSAVAPLARRGGVLTVHMLGNLLWFTKGYDVALDVARIAKSQGMPIRIVIGGRAIEGERDLTVAIRDAGLADMMEWRGTITEPRRFLQDADAFLLLSRYEGTPNALLEAMAVGLPCVVTDVGDLALFAQQGAGISVVPIESADAVVSELGKLLQDPENARARGLAARRFCSERFSEARMLDEVEAVLAP